jgi:hypothetical protein
MPRITASIYSAATRASTGTEAMSGQYQNFGVEFLYPENWDIVDEQLDKWPYRVSVQSPGSGYWELQVYPSRIDLGHLSGQVLQAMRQEYPDLESEVVTDDVYELPAVGYDLSFFCLDLLVTSKIRCLDVGSRTYLLIYQAESREFDRQELVFDAISKSLLAE